MATPSTMFDENAVQCVPPIYPNTLIDRGYTYSICGGICLGSCGLELL